MKTLFFISFIVLFYSITSAQIYVTNINDLLAGSTDEELYTVQYASAIGGDSLIFIKLRRNESIFSLEIKPKNSVYTLLEHKLIIFHPNGVVSLSISNFKMNFYMVGNEQYFAASGQYKTYYKTGFLRSSYSLDTLGNVVDTLFFYNKNGKLLFKNYYRQGKIWNGQELILTYNTSYKIEKSVYNVIREGKVILSLDVDIVNEIVLNQRFGRRKYKKIIEQFSFSESPAIKRIYPQFLDFIQEKP